MSKLTPEMEAHLRAIIQDWRNATGRSLPSDLQGFDALLGELDAVRAELDRLRGAFMRDGQKTPPEGMMRFLAGAPAADEPMILSTHHFTEVTLGDKWTPRAGIGMPLHLPAKLPEGVQPGDTVRIEQDGGLAPVVTIQRADPTTLADITRKAAEAGFESLDDLFAALHRPSATPAAWIGRPANFGSRPFICDSKELALEWLEQQEDIQDIAGRKDDPRPYVRPLFTSPTLITKAQVKQSDRRAESVNAELMGALETARDHIDMDALRISHCKDAEKIMSAIARAKSAQSQQADVRGVPEGWRDQLALLPERLNDDADMHDRAGNNSEAEDRRARAYEVEQMLATPPAPASLTDKWGAGPLLDAYENGIDAVAQKLRQILDGEPCVMSSPPELAEVAKRLSAAPAAQGVDAVAAAEAKQRQRRQERFANRAPSPATADFDLPAPNDNIDTEQRQPNSCAASHLCDCQEAGQPCQRQSNAETPAETCAADHAEDVRRSQELLFNGLTPAETSATASVADNVPPTGFIDYVSRNYFFSDPAWHAKKLWAAAQDFGKPTLKPLSPEKVRDIANSCGIHRLGDVTWQEFARLLTKALQKGGE